MLEMPVTVSFSGHETFPFRYAWTKLSRLQEYLMTKPVGVAGGFAPALQLDAW